MLIGELSTLTGASARSLRHYESLGLLQTIRTDNGYRRYSEESIERVKAIRFLLASGVTTATIARILPAMMYQHCKLADPSVRSAIELEAARIKSQIDHLNQSHTVLTDALRKGISVGLSKIRGITARSTDNKASRVLCSTSTWVFYTPFGCTTAEMDIGNGAFVSELCSIVNGFRGHQIP